MADEEKELELEVDEEGKPKSKLMMIIIIVVVLLVGIGAAVFFMMGGEESEEVEGDEEAAVEEVKLPAVYVPLRPAFVVNFATPGTQRFLQVEVSIMTRNPAVVPVVEQHIPLIRNNLVSLLSAQEYDEVTTPEGKDSLRQAALEVVQGIIQEEMGEPGIEQVLFTSFVIQ